MGLGVPRLWEAQERGLCTHIFDARGAPVIHAAKRIAWCLPQLSLAAEQHRAVAADVACEGFVYFADLNCVFFVGLARRLLNSFFLLFVLFLHGGCIFSVVRVLMTVG